MSDQLVIKVDEEAYELSDLAARVSGESKKELVSRAVKDYVAKDEELMRGIEVLKDIEG